MPVSNKIEKLKEKLILTALESTEFKNLLKESIIDIKSRAEQVDNEATIESLFENEIYALLKQINFKFSPDKEVTVDTRRHVKKGRIDSKIGAVVIEYKHYSKLKITEDINKATEQIKDYLLGLSMVKPLYYYGFVTDGLKCKEIIFEKNNLLSESVLVDLTEVELLRLVKNIILLEKTALTPENLIKDFCYPRDDNLVYNLTRKLFSMIKSAPTKKTIMLKQEWEQLFKLGHEDKSQQRMIQERDKQLQDIIGKKFFENDQYNALFALQTTYAIIIKLISYRILSELRFERPMKSYHSQLEANNRTLQIFCETLENGEIFRDLGIFNLLEGDFFSWYSDSKQWDSDMADYIRKILEILVRYENASDVFKTKRAIDLFKGLYENIVPQVVRSSLGEFYTPAWLAEHVFRSVKPQGYWRGLDPCAGSGTFVLAMIDSVLKELENELEEKQLKEVLHRVQAIDLNPLAVLTCRINYFIRISHLIPERPYYLQIPVYLGDACYVPEIKKISGVECLTYSIQTIEETIDIVIPKKLTEDIQKFSKIMADYEKRIKKLDGVGGLKLFIDNLNESENTPDIFKELQKLTQQLVNLEKKEWNGIWARIITNFLITANMGRFNIIIGNPPWIDWKNLPSGYRRRIISLCVDRKLFSGDGRTGGINLNVCALIASVSIENWLEEDGKLAFLMPKVIAFQQSYEGFRTFKSNDIERDFLAFYDWSKAGHPFYPITERFMTYIIGAKKERSKTIPVKTYIKRKKEKIAGEKHISFEDAMDRLIENDSIAGQINPNSTIYTFADSISDLNTFSKISGQPNYIGREGIEFYPQELFLFVIETPPVQPTEGCQYVKNTQFKKSKYKIPKDVIELETRYLFPLVRGTEISKFQHDYSNFIVPFPYERDNPKQPLNRDELSKKSPHLLDYYIKYQYIIEEQTDYSDKIRGPDAGEFYGLARVGPYSFSDYYVAFRDNTKWCAVVVSPIQTSWGGYKRFVFQNHAVSICEDMDNHYITQDEAHYICAILNAPIVEKYIIQSSDSRSFKIRPPIKIPKYDENNIVHKKLSELSKKAHKDQQTVDDILSEIDTLYLKIV